MKVLLTMNRGRTERILKTNTKAQEEKIHAK